MSARSLTTRLPVAQMPEELAELATSIRQAGDLHPHDRRGCPDCALEGHELDATHCRACGGALPARFE